MSKGTTIFAFVLGATVGSVVTWGIVKKKYEQIAQEEFKSMEEYYSKRQKETADTEATDDDESNEPDESQVTVEDVYDEYASKLTDEGYTSYSTINEAKGGKKSMNDKPYVISPDEFGEKEDYDTVSLAYYADGVLADENNDPIHDVDEIVGRESLNTFGEYEPDSVYVRNDLMMTDYEILLDERRYIDSKRMAHTPQVDD